MPEGSFPPERVTLLNTTQVNSPYSAGAPRPARSTDSMRV